MHVYSVVPNTRLDGLTKVLNLIALSRCTSVVVEEPGNFLETAGVSASAGCALPWVWEAPLSDFVETLASDNFVKLHVAPCLCVKRESASNQLLTLESIGQRSLRSCLPEHPWFSRGGSGFQIEASATVVAMSLIRQPDLADALSPALACAGLLALVNRVLTIPHLTVESALKAAAAGLVTSDGSLGLSSDGPHGIVHAILNAARSRWINCLHDAFMILGVLVCEKDATVLPPHYADLCSEIHHDVFQSSQTMVSSISAGLSPMRAQRWAQLASEEFLQVAQLSRVDGPSLAEISIKKLLEVSVITAKGDGKLRERDLHSEVGVRKPAKMVKIRPLGLCPRHDEAIPLPWHIRLGEGIGPVVHVMGISAVSESDHVFLELLLYVDGGREGGPECLATFSVGACRSLSRFSSLAWQCEFNMPGHQKPELVSAVAVSHFGLEVLLRCPLPNSAIHILRSVRSFPKGRVLTVSLVAQHEPAWSSTSPLPVCLQHRGHWVPWWRNMQGNGKQPWGVVGCSAPMWLAKPEHSHLVQQWLDYHRLVGFEKFVIYDLDGSLADAVASFVADGFVIYIRLWPQQLSPGVCTFLHKAKTDDGEEPAWAKYCTQTQAEAHCVWNLRGKARWVMLVHSFDAYAASSTGLREGIQPLLSRLEPRRSQIAALGVTRFDFGGVSEGTGAVPARFYWRQRKPLFLNGEHRGAFDIMSSESYYHAGTILVNPENIWSMLTHWARGRPGSIHLTLPPEILRLNHYVDVLGEPRCAIAAAGGDPPCDTFDNSSAWFSTFLADRVLFQPSVMTSDTGKSENRLLVVVPGHGKTKRTEVLLDSLRRLRSEAWISEKDLACLIFVYNCFSDFLTSFAVQALRKEMGCSFVLRPKGVFLEFLTDPAITYTIETIQPRHVLLLMDDIALGSEHPMRVRELMSIMHRNQLDVISASLIGTHLSYDGMRPTQPRRSMAVGRIVTFIEWETPLFTVEAFGVLCRMVRPSLSRTWGYDELFPGCFKYEVGRLPRMGIVDTMQVVHTGAWLASSTLQDTVVYAENEAIVAFYKDKFNITPTPIRMRCGYLF